MKPDLKQSWVNALRSEEYSQGRHLLRDSGDNYCCLGVLCDLVAPQVWKAPEFEDEAYHHDDGSSAMPSKLVLLDVELSQTFAEELARMNDDGTPFSEIADYIEKNL